MNQQLWNREGKSHWYVSEEVPPDWTQTTPGYRFLRVTAEEAIEFLRKEEAPV
jgi:hypothetical protein